MKTKDFLSSLRVAIGTILSASASEYTTPAAQAGQSSIDPLAIDAFQRMGAYLRTLEALQVSIIITSDDTTTDGRKLRLSTTIELLAQQPNHMRAVVTSDQREDRTYYYDGKNFTLWAPYMNLYATVPAPPTIGQLASRFDEKLAASLPLMDLFRGNAGRSDETGITFALNAGPVRIDGVSCNQYAFHQPGIDLKIWIQTFGEPLPHRLILTTLSKAPRRQMEIAYAWKPVPSALDEAVFTFIPPEGATRITTREPAVVSSSG